MAELHVIGQIKSAKDFQEQQLFCKWSFHVGGGWKLMDGVAEGQTQESRDPYSNIPVWDHPIDLYYTTKRLQGSPKLLVRIYCRDEHDRILFIAYGVSSIPLSPGAHAITCHTWKPIGNWVDRLRDRFLGMTLQFKSPNALVNTEDRFELVTQTMGSVDINLHILVRNFDKFGFLSCLASTIRAQTTETTWALVSTDNGTVMPIDSDSENITNNATNTIVTAEIESSHTTVGTMIELQNCTVKFDKNSTSSNNTLNSPNAILRNITRRKTKSSEICECDLTVNSCDINCCCDINCRDLNVTELFRCNEPSRKGNGLRYCNEDDISMHNDSLHFIEKLGSNLFCIVHENLPSSYAITDEPIISNQTVLRDIVNGNRRSRFKWNLNEPRLRLRFDAEEPYRYNDVIWKIKNNVLKTLEIPQAGFTGICSLRRVLKHLEDWNDSCMPSTLNNSNAYLFPTAYNNFSVIASPVLYNDTYIRADDQICPRNICLPINSYYCSASWNYCQNTTAPNGRCMNGSCRDIVKGMRYEITHNGLKGIERVDAYFRIGNASGKFYQDFRVEFKWAHVNGTKVFRSSGNPGYITGNPLIVGSLVSNQTSSMDFDYIRINETMHYLDLPVGGRDQHCDRRYNVRMEENVKLICNVIIETNNFSTNTCISLHKDIMQHFLNDAFLGGEVAKDAAIYVSKWGYVDANNTDDWTKVLFDGIPDSVITGSTNDDEIVCSGLIDSLRLDVVYSRLPDPKSPENHKILAASVTFAEASDFYWEKCATENCTNVLDVGIVSYVTFHDVSKPSRYHLADGFNLDVTLPHDFFYPFVSNARRSVKSIFSQIFILVGVCSTRMIF